MYAVAVLTIGDSAAELVIVADARRHGQTHERFSVPTADAADRELAARGYTRTGDWAAADDTVNTASIRPSA